MKRYEYKILKTHYDIDEQIKQINTKGLDGWELVSVVNRSIYGSDYTFYYFKREIYD